MQLKCVIVDDDSVSISVISDLLRSIPNVEVVATFEDVMLVYEFLGLNPIDFIFLDIEMPNLNGLEFLKSLPHPPLTIITSANNTYALESFDLNVVDYVLKPVTLERIRRAIDKVLLRVVKPVTPSPYLYLKENKRIVKVNTNDILYFESVKDYVKVVTKHKTVTTMQSISHFEGLLNPNAFIRVHRSFIVAIRYIEAYSNSTIEIGQIEIQIGRLNKSEILRKLDSLLKPEGS